MASKVTQSEFMANYGEIKGSEVADKLKEPPKTGIIKLPGGIENGILKLKECYFGRNENGDFFRIAGTAESPENHDHVPVRGLQSSQVVNFKPETWDKPDDRGVSPKDEVINYMRMLVGDGPFRVEKINLITIAESIHTRANDNTKKPIYVWFSTTKSDGKKINPKTGQPYPPRVFENWHGTRGLENYTPKNAGNLAPGLKVKEEDTKHNGTHKEVEKPKKDESKEPEKPIEYSDDQDLSSLATRAANGDSEAESTIREMFTKLGYTDDDWDGTTSFDQIVDMIRGGAKEGTKEEGKKEEKEFIPEPGNTVCKYAPPDARSKVGKRLKQVDVSVEKIDKRSKTMTLKALDSDKVFEGVKWNDEHVSYD